VQAADCFTQALSVDPWYVKALLNRADIFISMNAPDKALKDYLRAIQLDPDRTAFISCRVGSLLGQKGAHKEAIEWFSRAIASDQAMVEAYHKRASAYLLTDEYEKALSDIQSVKKKGGTIDRELQQMLQNFSQSMQSRRAVERRA
jgi:tetratricopeptide (TPR) repeat protein